MTTRGTDARPTPTVVLSFDVEEHDRIEAAARLSVGAESKAEYARRMEATTRRLLDTLAEAGTGVTATFFVVGAIARTHPRLVRAIADAGHEVASHSHTHQSILRMTPEAFRADLRASRDALEQASGTSVVGFRAPTFSVTRATAWALDILADEGFAYDSSVFPVRHDRYGIPDAPRVPHRVAGGSLVELPPLTWRVGGQNLPVAGGGYFRLFPLAFMQAGIRQMAGIGAPAVLYFHPWEFDPHQPRLPLGRVSKWRTYVGTGKTTGRLRRLLAGGYRFRRADAVAGALRGGYDEPVGSPALSEVSHDTLWPDHP